MITMFVIASALAVASGLGVILARSPVHQVIAMVLNFIALAVLYLSLDAEFMAVIQLIVYAGAVMVLFLFVVALLTVRAEPEKLRKSPLWGQEALGSGLGVLLLAALALTVWLGERAGTGAVPDGFGSIQFFGYELLTTHVLAFELTAFVLLVAAIGVVILVGRREV